MGMELRGFWEGGGCEDHVELPHVRVALQFPVYLCACVYLPPPLPHFRRHQICGGGGGPFFEVESFQVQWGGGS